MNDATLRLENCTLRANRATSSGGGLVVQRSGSVAMVINSTLVDNHAGQFGGGGAIVKLNAQLTFQASTLLGNSVGLFGGHSAETCGGGALLSRGALSLVDTVVEHNVAIACGGGVGPPLRPERPGIRSD